MDKQARIEVRLINNEVYFYDLPCDIATAPMGLLVTPRNGTTKLFTYPNIKKVDFGTRLKFAQAGPNKRLVIPM